MTTPTICMYDHAILACTMAMVLSFVWIYNLYEYGTVHLNEDCFAYNHTFESIDHRSRLEFPSPGPQGSALTRFFRVVGVLGWPSCTGDAFAVVSCYSIYSEVTCTEMVRMLVYGPWVYVESFYFAFCFKHTIISRDCNRQDCHHQRLHLAVGHGHHYDWFLCDPRYRSLSHRVHRVRMYDLCGIVEFWSFKWISMKTKSFRCSFHQSKLIANA